MNFSACGRSVSEAEQSQLHRIVRQGGGPPTPDQRNHVALAAAIDSYPANIPPTDVQLRHPPALQTATPMYRKPSSALWSGDPATPCRVEVGKWVLERDPTLDVVRDALRPAHFQKPRFSTRKMVGLRSAIPSFVPSGPARF
jgi:hypothetical protein